MVLLLCLQLNPLNLIFPLVKKMWSAASFVGVISTKGVNLPMGDPPLPEMVDGGMGLLPMVTTPTDTTLGEDFQEDVKPVSQYMK